MDPIKLHEILGGKIEVKSKVSLDKDNLSVYYTPGVAEVSKAIVRDPKRLRHLTGKSNMVAIVTDGTAVLGLGDIGAEAALPVMEGKAAIFSDFAGVSAVPICLATKNTDEIIETVKNIAPAFGGINLEDISAPRCFEIEERLSADLDIPVFHDDQHGTAIVVLAGLMNALFLLKKDKSVRVVISGAGAAGIAISDLLISYGIKNICICDSRGVVGDKRTDINGHKKRILDSSISFCASGSCQDALSGADVLIGVSRPNQFQAQDIKKMSENPIVFALANPVPEIMPDEAKKGGAVIVATGRSDYPNQINNALVFPGLFRALLDFDVKKVTPELKIKVAEAIASVVKCPQKDQIIPSIFDKKVVRAISDSIKKFSS